MTIFGTAVFTVIEVITLAVWLALVRSALAVYRRVAAVVLFIGLVLEHILQFNTARGRRLLDGLVPLDFSRLPIKGILGFSAVETAIWIAWLALSMAAGNVVGFVFLFTTLIAKHAIADNVIAGRPFLAFRYLANGSIVTASFFEAIGGQAWLINVLAGNVVQGVVILAIFSFIEHLILILLAQREAAGRT